MFDITNKYIPVLDHGFVGLVDYMGSDEAIERAARVSYGAGTRPKNKTRGLIRYLMRNRHTSPVEQAEVVLHCAMPMFVARQWVRHRTASLNEYSGRYSEMPFSFYTPEPSRITTQDEINKQSSTDEQLEASDWLSHYMGLANQGSYNNYQTLLDNNVSREVARTVLPLSGYTQWYWKIDLHNLFHFINLRADPHAQQEIRVYAEVICAIVQHLFPLTYEAWEDYFLNSITLTYPELLKMAGQTEVSLSTSEEKQYEEKMRFLEDPLAMKKEYPSIDFYDFLSPEEAESRFMGGN